MPNGTPETPPVPGQISEDERRRINEQAQAASGERAALYPMEGGDLIKEINEAKMEDLGEIIEEALAFREGLPFGISDYDLSQPETVLDLQTLFGSSEGMRERPYVFYIDAAIKEKIRSEVRIIKKRARREKRGLSNEEKKTVAELKILENHREGRKVIDKAFVERTTVCEQAEEVAKLLGYQFSKPDKGHWQGALWGKFGEKVDVVLREIVKMGMSPEELGKQDITPVKDSSGKEMDGKVYATGFKNAGTFREWLTPLVKAAGDRMDVVWFAWRLALLWELPNQFGAKTDEEGEIKIADPPIGSDLFKWTAHLEKQRRSEWGLDASGKKRVRASKYLTHTGYPLSLGEIGNLCESFLHWAKIYPKEGDETTTLWELWWKEKIKIGGDFNTDKQILPWDQTELQPRGLDTEELGTGSFGLWRLKAFRAFRVLEDIRSRPSLRDLSDPDFFASRLRNWEKVKGRAGDGSPGVKDKNLKPEENPRTWWVAGLIMAHHLEADKKIPLVQKDLEKAYRTYTAGETWSIEVKGQMGTRTTSIWEILNHAYQCGFLRSKDIDWLVENLHIPKPLGGAKAY